MHLFVHRADLEAVRTMADQMRRQEKLRKKGLAAWRDSLQHPQQVHCVISLQHAPQFAVKSMWHAHVSAHGYANR